MYVIQQSNKQIGLDNEILIIIYVVKLSVNLNVFVYRP